MEWGWKAEGREHDIYVGDGRVGDEVDGWVGISMDVFHAVH